ncbi:Calpain-1 catalytic subunit [Oryzias melastigma]|uniref:Calpain-1 catalytic subunit n=1 Tax=Oryzias melastigma TaxID=30732 RepID=A0A834BVB8_ORYME|nr:Calpain-1 catalytic subunit [Oryzias melastigma]
MPPPGVCLNIMEARHIQDGYGSPTNPYREFGQDFQQLTDYCLSQRVKFLDETFPPERSSIGEGVLSPSDLARVEWLRPAKIAPTPSFVVRGVSRFDFGQGTVGNCWFLASIGALTFQKNIFKQVVPLEQTFDQNYCGLFHFRFWRFGKWVDVVIDDKLPTINGRLIFVRSQNQNEFWPALLEKAYAKVCGSYTDMTAGTPSEAMMDFTGGVHIYIRLSEPPQNLWELMCRAGKSGVLMCCGTDQGETSSNTLSPNGLVLGHAYTVTGVMQLVSRGKPVNLVRLWNPWRTGEWIGDWSDRSPLWQTVSPQDREKCHSVDDDGEFWMTLEDFCKLYSDLDICGMDPSFLDETSGPWKSSVYEGRWVLGTTAGGCMNHKETFWTNPQFRVQISGEYSEKADDKNTLVSLMQKPDKRKRHLVKNLHVGFSIFEVTQQYKAQVGKFPASFFSTHRPVAQTKIFMNAREVMEFIRLKPGEYLIVPSTFKPNESASFLLTIHSKIETHGFENSRDYDNQMFEKTKRVKNSEEDEKKDIFFRQHSNKYEEVDPEQLQKILNDQILKGDLKSGGFSIDACRSMVALMDSSITGRLNSKEFVRLWNKVVAFKDIFFRTDVSRTGTLSLSELRNAIVASGIKVNDELLNLMALRYGASSGHMTLESFISLILRLECMCKVFQQLSDGKTMTLQESEWMYVAMYT